MPKEKRYIPFDIYWLQLLVRILSLITLLEPQPTTENYNWELRVFFFTCDIDLYKTDQFFAANKTEHYFANQWIKIMKKK